MASLALMVVGAAIGSGFTGLVAASGAVILSGMAIGAMIGGIVGAAIDTFFLFDQGSMQVPPQSIDGQRMNDIMMMSASEGTPMFECHGIYNKIPGQCLYVSNIRETSVTTVASCFVAGSRVNMADGSFKPIESIKVGDKVKSCKLPKFFKRFRKPKIVEGVVTEVFDTDEIVRLIQITDSQTRTFKLTAGHPVFADGKWIYAGDIEPGMELLSVQPERQPITVASVETINPSHANGRVYNLEVEGEHNYFVENMLFHNGGKGGGGGGAVTIETTRYYYDCDMVVGLCDATNGKHINSSYTPEQNPDGTNVLPGEYDRGRGEGVRKLWFNDKKVWDSYRYRGNVANPGYETADLYVSWKANMTDEWVQGSLWMGGYYLQKVTSFDITYKLQDTADSDDVAFGESVVGNDPWFIQFLSSPYNDFLGDGSGNNIGNNSERGKCISRSSNEVIMRFTPTTSVYPPQSPSGDTSGYYANGVNWNHRPFAALGNAANNDWYGHKTLDSQKSITSSFRWSQSVDPWKPGVFDSTGVATFYTGNQSEPDNTVLVPKYGSANVPCFKGTAYISMKNIQLEDFGNTIPQVIAQVQAKRGTGTDYTQANANEAIERMLSDAGWSAGMYDTSGIADNAKNTLWGYNTSGVSTLESRLKSIMLFYDLRARSINGKLYFYEASATGSSYESSAVASELGCKEPGEPPQQPLEVSDTVDWRTPSQVNATYYDINKELQRGSTTATKVDMGTDQPNVKNLHFPLASTAGRAKQRASQILWESEQFRQTASLRLPPNRIDVMVGDLLSVTNSAGESFSVRVQEVNRGDNFLHEVMGVLEESRFTDFAEDADENQGTDEEVDQTIPDMFAVAFQELALENTDINDPTFYFGGCCLAGTVFSGATAAISFDGTNWSFVSAYPGGGQASAGQLLPHTGTTVLQPWDNPGQLIDRVNTARVALQDGATLTNATELEMLDGKNRIIIGKEYLGFMTATLVSTEDDGSKIYDLTNLLRNIRGSVGDATQQMSHVLFDPVMLVVNGNTLQSFAKYTSNMDEVNQTIYYKLLPNGAEVADVTNGGSVQLLGRTAQCLSPCNFSVVRFNAEFDNEGSTDPTLPAIHFQAGDAIIRFNRRGRTIKRIFSQTGMPSIPNETEFNIEIMNNGNIDGTVLRTLTHNSNGASGTQNHPLYNGQFQVVYTKAQQTADFGSGSEPTSAGSLNMRVHQVGDLFARGIEAKVSG